jgi:hypothetical protein
LLLLSPCGTGGGSSIEKALPIPNKSPYLGGFINTKKVHKYQKSFQKKKFTFLVFITFFGI